MSKRKIRAGPATRAALEKAKEALAKGIVEDEAILKRTLGRGDPTSIVPIPPPAPVRVTDLMATLARNAGYEVLGESYELVDQDVLQVGFKLRRRTQ